MRTLVSVSLVIGVGGSARAQVATDPPAPAGEPAPLLPPSAVTPVPRPPPTGEFYIGAAYRTDDGFTGHFGISQSNLFHTGNALSLDATISERLQRFSTKFTDPNLDGGRLKLTAELFSERRVLDSTGDIVRQSEGVDVSLSTRVADHTHAFVGYRFEHVDDVGMLAWLRAGTDYSTLDQAAMPTRGTSVGMTVGVANGAYGSDYDLMRIDAWFNTHDPLGPFIFHTGGRFAAITSTSDQAIPFTEMLYFNGSSDIRGFNYGGLDGYSPANMMGTWRTELELPIAYGISARGFWDAGAMFQSNGVGTLAQSVGGGLMWRSPLGPISVDYAVPFTGQPPRFLFAIGQTF